MKPDLWDDAGPFEYRHMPEDCLSAFFTEERDMLQITAEQGGFWLSNSREMGADRYESLQDAKDAGDELIASAEAIQDAVLLKEAGLPETQWRVSYEDGLRFEQKEGPLWILANTESLSTRQSWDLYEGDDPILTNARDISTIVSVVRARE